MGAAQHEPGLGGGGHEGTSRMFVAVVPPEPILDHLDAISRPDVRGVRWTRRAQWHVTLQFLGSVDETAARAGIRRVRADPVEATLVPRLVRLGEGAVALEVRGLEPVHRAVVEATAAAGFAPPKRRFRGHLTLVRLRDGAVVDLDPPAGEQRWVVDEVVLFRSILGSGPAVHEVVDRVALDGSAPGA